MRKNFVPEKLSRKRAIRVFIILMLVGMTATACGFAPNSWRNLFRSEKSTSTATIIATKSEEEALSALEESENEQVTLPPSLTETTKTTKPSLTPSHTASSTFTQTLTYTASPTSTNTYVYIPPTNIQIPPTNTQIPPTNTRIPPSNTPIPPSATLNPTDTPTTEQPTQEVTAEPTLEPTQPVCYALTLTHKGEGSDPSASPKHSEGCPNDKYVAGENIFLSNVIPASGWEIDSWIGTIDNSSTNNTNRVNMSAHDHIAKVVYVIAST